MLFYDQIRPINIFYWHFWQNYVTSRELSKRWKKRVTIGKVLCIRVKIWSESCLLPYFKTAILISDDSSVINNDPVYAFACLAIIKLPRIIVTMRKSDTRRFQRYRAAFCGLLLAFSTLAAHQRELIARARSSGRCKTVRQTDTFVACRVTIERNVFKREVLREMR